HAHTQMDMELVPANAVDGAYIWHHRNELLQRFQENIALLGLDERTRIQPFIRTMQEKLAQDPARESGIRMRDVVSQNLGATLFEWLGANTADMARLNKTILSDPQVSSDPQRYILAAGSKNRVRLSEDSIFHAGGISEIVIEAQTESQGTVYVRFASGHSVSGIFHFDNGQFTEMTNIPLDGSTFNGQQALQTFLEHALSVTYASIVRREQTIAEPGGTQPAVGVVEGEVVSGGRPISGEVPPPSGQAPRQRGITTRRAPRASGGGTTEGAGQSERTPAQTHYVDGHIQRFPHLEDTLLPVLKRVQNDPSDQAARRELEEILQWFEQPDANAHDKNGNPVDRRRLVWGLPPSFAGKNEEMWVRNPLVDQVEPPEDTNDIDGWNRFFESIIFLRNYFSPYIRPADTDVQQVWRAFHIEGNLLDQTTTFLSAIAEGLAVGGQRRARRSDATDSTTTVSDN
ncbi:MAG: hypothetical protein ACREGI_01850, partial [Candidatus Levyibacteriota bacterium]